MSNPMGIYMITNTITGDTYVGSAFNLNLRRHIHASNLRLNRHHNAKLQRAWNKYGSEAFLHTILEVVLDKTALAPREQHWIDAMKSLEHGYNLAPIARSSLGRTLSPETRAKIAAAKRGKPLTADHRQRVGDAFRGKAQSPEHIEKRAAKKRGHALSSELRQAISVARTGYKVPPEIVEKIASKNRGKKRTPEQIEAASAPRRGAKRTVEARRKMSEAQKKRFSANPGKRNDLGHYIK